MDEQTRKHREAEFNAILPLSDVYKPLLVISTTSGRTKHLSITNEELEQIRAILTK